MVFLLLRLYIVYFTVAVLFLFTDSVDYTQDVEFILINTILYFFVPSHFS
jgi:hypothetical protein